MTDDTAVPLRGVGGWLSWFIFVILGLGGLIDLGYAISYATSGETFAAVLTLVGVSLAAVAVVLMLQENPKGLLFARLRLGFVMFVGALALLGSAGATGWKQIGFGLVCLCYLGASERVRNTYTPEKACS